MTTTLASPSTTPCEAIAGWLCAGAGVLVTRLLYLKSGEAADFAIVDAAMNDLMRPALYDAHHGVITVHSPRPDASGRPIRLVGPICESSDDFGAYRDLGALRADDLLAFRDVGAYGAAMSSTYNGRDLIPEAFVEGSHFRLIRKRLAIDEVLRLEQAGPWQQAG